MKKMIFLSALVLASFCGTAFSKSTDDLSLLGYVWSVTGKQLVGDIVKVTVYSTPNVDTSKPDILLARLDLKCATPSCFPVVAKINTSIREADAAGVAAGTLPPVAYSFNGSYKLVPTSDKSPTISFKGHLTAKGNLVFSRSTKFVDPADLSKAKYNTEGPERTFVNTSLVGGNTQ